jgi:MFS transporter, DHA1 family, tetracycline resistance protein
MNAKQRKSFFSLLLVLSLERFGWGGIVFVLFGTFILEPKFGFLHPDTSIDIRNIYLGILFSTYPLAQFFGAPIFGDFADLVGRKKALYVSILGTIFAYILCGFAILIKEIYLLMFSRLLTGFFAGNISICFAAIADLSHTEKERSRNFGIVTVIWGIGWIFAMLAGAYLINPSIFPLFSPAFPFWLTVLLSSLSFLSVYKYFTETFHPPKKVVFDFIKGIHNIRFALQIKEVQLYFIVLLFWSIGWGLIVQWFSAYSILEYKISQSSISWSLLIQGLFWMMGGSIINPLLTIRYNSLWIARFAFLFCALFILIAAFSYHLLFFDYMFWIATIFSAFAFSNAMNIISINVPKNIQGVTMGLTQSFTSLGSLIVPIIGGSLGALNARLFYPVAGCLLLIAFILLMVKKRKTTS